MNRDDSSDSLFLLLSPIESKLEERFRLKTQQTLHGSPLMRAKHALRRTLSGSRRHQSEQKRGTNETGRFCRFCRSRLGRFCVCEVHGFIYACYIMYFCAIYRIDASFLAVKEAQDACIWLKMAGFPQYVQRCKVGVAYC